MIEICPSDSRQSQNGNKIFLPNFSLCLVLIFTFPISSFAFQPMPRLYSQTQSAARVRGRHRWERETHTHSQEWWRFLGKIRDRGSEVRDKRRRGRGKKRPRRRAGYSSEGKWESSVSWEKRWNKRTHSLINMVGMWPHGKSLSWQ